MRRFFSILVSVLLAIAVGFAAWHALDREPPEATWLQVEAPRVAEAGSEFVVRVMLRPDEKHSASAADTTRFVRVDLHGFTGRHEWRNCIVSAPAQPIAAGGSPGGVFEFSLPVPQRADLRYVAIVVYLSRNGEWDDRIVAASSLEIWYRSQTGASPLTTARERTAMYPQIPGAAIEQGDVLAISILMALGWVVCGACAWRADQRTKAGGRHHRLLPVAALFAAAWELLPLERALGSLARTIVSALHLYNMRMGFQQLVTAIVAALAVVFVYRTLRRAEHPALRWQMIGLTVYAAVTFTNFLSLHLVDAIFAQKLGGIPLRQWIQLAGMALSLFGAIRHSKSSPQAAGSM